MSEAEGSDGDAEMAVGDDDTIWLGSATDLNGEEFKEALQAVHAMQGHVRDLQSSLADLDVGLDREDAIRLVYGRNSGMSLNQVRSAFGVIDAFVEEDVDDIAPRLMADQTSELTIAEAAEVWDDLVELAQKYGNDPEEDT